VGISKKPEIFLKFSLDNDDNNSILIV